MKYDHSVIYNSKLYRAGEEVPVKETKAKKTEVKTKEVSANDTKPVKSTKAGNRADK